MPEPEVRTAPVPQERHWFVQEAGVDGKYLRIHASQLVVDEETATLRFLNADGSVFTEFPGGTWTFMEHGDPAF